MELNRATTGQPEPAAAGAREAAAVEDTLLEDLVAEATDDFLDRQRRGERPEIEDYARRYPQIAAVLRDLLPALCSAQRGSSASGRFTHAPSDPSSGSRIAGWAANHVGAVGGATPESSPTPSGGAAAPLGTLGEFRLIREVGRGGMGVVYEAEQISLGRRVALKVLPLAAALDPRQLQRFRLEAQAAAHLHHSHIVPIYSVGCERGAYYYAMQFIEGRSLADVIAELEAQQPGRKSRGRGAAGAPITADSPTISDVRSVNHVSDGHVSDVLPTSSQPIGAAAEAAKRDAIKPNAVKTNAVPAAETAIGRQASATLHSPTLGSVQNLDHFRAIAQLGADVAEALDYAHCMGVIHRDVKPANLLLDTQGLIYIADFGLAQLQGDSRLTRTGDLVGTLRYMSPEQTTARHGVVDHRADIYSLGATLYELLTLAPAFDAADRGALLRQIAEEEPPAPRQHNRAIPVDLETIVLKALTKEPARRYGTARELADDLRRFLEHRPITARRPTVAQRVSKWVRRHRAIVSTAAGLLLVLGALVAWQRHLAFTELSDALEAKEKALEAQAQATSQARAARAQADAERSRAVEAFERASQALDAFTEVSDSRMADWPELQGLRRMLLATALNSYDDIIDQAGDDRDLQLHLAERQMRAADIMDKIGSREEVQTALEQARQMQERLLRGQPLSPIWQGGLTQIYHRLSELRGGRELSFLVQPSVQQHLELTQQQIDEIEKLRSERLPYDRPPRRGDDQPRALTADQWEGAFDRLSGQEQQLDQILNPAQNARLDQIILQHNLQHVGQRRGRKAFTDPELVDELKLTGEQQQQFVQLGEEWNAALDRLRELQSGGPPSDADQESRLELWRGFQKRISSMLTDQQKARWNELIGAPFYVDLFGPRHDGFSPFGSHGRHGHHRHRSESRDETNENELNGAGTSKGESESGGRGGETP